jgi:hypothetical protein
LESLLTLPEDDVADGWCCPGTGADMATIERGISIKPKPRKVNNNSSDFLCNTHLSPAAKSAISGVGRKEVIRDNSLRKVKKGSSKDEGCQ